MLPNGVSARAANAVTPAGSAYTVCCRDGMSHGRLPAARAASAIAARRVLLVRSAAGTTTRAVIVIAANPPITAGTSDRHSRPVQRHGASAGLTTARSAQGRPA